MSVLKKTDNRRRALAERISRFTISGTDSSETTTVVDTSKSTSAARVEKVVRNSVRRARGSQVMQHFPAS